MHHDVHWIEVTDLKRTYIERLEAVTARSRDCLAKMVNGHTSRSQHDDALHIINTLPFPRSEVVTLRGLANAPLRVVDAAGAPVPSQCIPSIDNPALHDLIFHVEIPACGAMSYCLTNEGAASLPGVELTAAQVQAAGNIRYTISANGTIQEAITADGRNVLSSAGNDLHYLNQDGQLIGGAGRSGKLVCYHSELGDIIRISAPIGDLPTEIEYLASPLMPWLDFTIRFHFNNHLIGEMWDDCSKLNMYWPTIGHAIRHDIPFGAINGDVELPLYAPSWLSVCGNNGGLALFNTGTPKHYVKDGIIANVLAWGRESYTNRMHISWLQQTQYDLSLKGCQQIHSAVQALGAKHSEVNLARYAQCINSPLTAFFAAQRTTPPLPRWSLDLSPTSLLSSAFFLRGDRPVCRFYEAGGISQSVNDLRRTLGAEVAVTDLQGNPLEVITPYRIGYLVLPHCLPA